jgi:hypothetical protein
VWVQNYKAELFSETKTPGHRAKMPRIYQILYQEEIVAINHTSFSFNFNIEKGVVQGNYWTGCRQGGRLTNNSTPPPNYHA